MGSSSRSRSRSKSPIHLDRFGRVIPKGRDRSRSPRRHRERRRSPLVIRLRRSRSRSKSPRRKYRSRSPRRSSSRIRRYSRSKSRSKSRSRSLSKQKEKSPGIHGSTNIQDVELMKSRVFIGNLPYEKVTKEELEAMFSKYGKILGISTHERGFGFIQFSKEEEGLEAVKNENGGLLKGFKIDIKMALEGRRGGGAGKPPPRSGPRGSSPGPYADRYPPPAGVRRPPPGAPVEARERSPLRGDPYEDRYRDPYRDPVLPPPRRDDPYYADSYRRPPPPDDPYLDRYRDDPYRYRRDPYGEPYRDPYYRDYYDAPRKPPQPADVEIILLNSKLKGYGEFIERKLVAKSMTALVSVIPEDRTIPQMMEEGSKRGHLFGIVINSQNEVHQSLTLNILHGTPQEHRNMPVDDALTLVGRSFETYVQTAREKTAAAAPPPERGAPAAPPTARAPPPFLPPGPDITYLLNLLADNRQLTIEEIDKVIGYLRERRDKLYETEGRRPPDSGYNVGDVRKEDNSLQQQQQELQAKILSILNGPGDSGAPQAPKPGPGLGMGNGAPPGGSSQSGMSSLINFDNPHVQKALDNLIQSGPNLLKNISSTPGIKPVGVGIMSREGEPMRREVGGGGGYGGLAGNAPMQQHGQVGGQGGLGGLQVQRPMYGSVPSAAPPRQGAPGQGMRRY
ncbi:nuclear receptor coactivator 5-like isoform X3 [Ostrea edulis]|uniref:nuclear receptor coactivator 5-like isoform X3 n=1 Tax=Ostrea edulis TaxID=37623 RepID=UPI0024AEE946|nr:nuclear receptor coactivator 5-like isoform X3 [Ostrea edulis]XP_055997472.1 nuclear receptor coactivator 5-like isoform X3 [Ostrea edulis]XP_055997520.1 nuclear receptor coactivator 5-like isoform X3 [Ostrea edulis]